MDILKKCHENLSDYISEKTGQGHDKANQNHTEEDGVFIGTFRQPIIKLIWGASTETDTETRKGGKH